MTKYTTNAAYINEVLDLWEAGVKTKLPSNYKVKNNMLIYTKESSSSNLECIYSTAREGIDGFYEYLKTVPLPYMIYVNHTRFLTVTEYSILDTCNIDADKYYQIYKLINKDEVISIRQSDGKYIGNSSNFRYLYYSTVQHCMIDRGYTMLPLYSIYNSFIDYKEIHTIIPAKEEYLLEGRHFSGTTLFQYESKYYLADLDRNDIKKGIWNYFICQLPKPCITIEEAYSSLRPSDVPEGSLRQGEYFFVPCKDDTPFSVPTLEMLAHKYVDKGILKACGYELNVDNTEFPKIFRLYSISSGTGYGSNRHVAQLYYKDPLNNVYVTGDITDPQHATISLEKWYRVYKNLSVRSLNTAGGVD